jgi:proteasome lid subunit RPN8/RPN11
MSSIINPSRLGGRYGVPPAITKTTLAHLQGHRTEAVCFWLGRPSEGVVTVAEVWVPRFTATAVSYDISPIEMLRLKSHLDASAQLIAIQVHSHPGSAFHSGTDDLNAASPWPGFISIVVPNFGSIASDFWGAVQVYELLGGGRWQHLSDAEVRKRFIIAGGR